MVRRVDAVLENEQVLTEETPQPVANSVVKVHYNEEVLRFRVGWPLKVGEVRSLVFSTLRDHHTARSRAEGKECSPEAAACPSTILYYGAKGNLLELCDATTRDFMGRHGDPARPIRLHVVNHCPTSLQHLLAQYYIVEGCGAPVSPARCLGNLEVDSAPSSSSTRLEEDSQTHSQSQSPCSSDADEFEVVNASSSEPASTACHEAIVIPAPESCSGMPGRSGDTDGIDDSAAAGATISPQEPSVSPARTPAHDTIASTSASVAAEFLGGSKTLLKGAPQASTTQAPPSSIAAAGISLPVAACAAANAVGDVLESARDRLNEAWASGKSTMLSPTHEQLQYALQASAALHWAKEKSASESKARLAKVLDLYKVRLRPVEADGNCQFRALSVQLYGDETHHSALRQRVVQQFRERRDRYEGYMLGSYEDYLERMARDSEWGDNVTLQAASDILNCEIHVLTDNAGSDLLNLSPEPREGGQQMDRPLCIAFVTEVHYDAVIHESE